MIARLRKTLREGATYGIISTLLVAGLAKLGLLDSAEEWCYDRRARYCQRFTPTPTDRLVHLDIDDAAIESIGRWPWTRATLAEMIDEVRLAQPKAFGLDIIFSDPEKLRIEKENDGKYVEVDDDRLFSNALQRLDCALIPVSLIASPPKDLTPIDRALHDLLLADIEFNEADLSAELVRRGINPQDIQKTGQHALIESFLTIRRNVVHDRLTDELQRRPLTRQQLRAMLLPKTALDIQSPVVRLVDEEYTHVMSEIPFQKFSIAPPANAPSILHADEEKTPILMLARTARASGFVDNQKDKSGIVRRIPLFMEYEGRVYPQIGVALAAMMLDADLKASRFTDGQVEIPRPMGQPPIVVPLITTYNAELHRSIPDCMDIPWFGPSDWEHMYDRSGGAHLSLNVLWDICLTRQRIRGNNLQADEALRALYQLYAPEKLDAFAKSPLPPDDPLGRMPVIQAALVDFAQFIEFAEKTDVAAIKDPNERADAERLAAQGPALRHVLAENPRLQAQFVSQRADLQKKLHGKAVLIGWAATGAIDEVTTSIHARCPGVVVHGTIFNAIMISSMWYRVPPWTNTCLILGIGFLATILTTHLPPFKALVAALLLAAAYAFINGFLIFDWGKHLASVAGPVFAVAVAWGACTLARLLSERFERARITKRFQVYIDPAIVNYAIAHPEIERIEGEVREMTVCFTDIVGFTSLAERLREKAVRILGRYIARMVPPIRNQHGLIHRFMGDGIMFSYGAPEPNPNMGINAVTTILEMHRELDKFNEELAVEGFPRLSIRAGVNTGMAVVGDSGAEDAAEYACLGDTTNMAARLESANTAVGTSTLISARTAELLAGKFLIRPVARLIVKGKREPMMTYEPIAYIDSATPGQKQLVELTTAMFDHFIAARFQECIKAADELEAAFGPSNLTARYRDLSREYIAELPADFQGHIVLQEK